MKILERVIDGRVRRIVKVDDMRFGFMAGKGTTDAIFVVSSCPRGRMVKVAASQTGSIRSRGPGFNPRGRQARRRLPICLEI